jgi:hypothetical protein
MLSAAELVRPRPKGLQASPLDALPQRMVLRTVSRQRAIGAVSSQTIEGFRTIWKRGVVGTFLKGSRKYLLLHVAEFSVPI